MTKEEVKESQQKWFDGIINKDVDAIMALYSEDASLKPTLSNEIRRTPDALKEYFVGSKFKEPGFLNNEFVAVRFVEGSPAITDNIAIDTGVYQFERGDGRISKAHYTFSYCELNGKVLITTQHSSLFV